jgi:hypothetical protein
VGEVDFEKYYSGCASNWLVGRCDRILGHQHLVWKVRNIPGCSEVDVHLFQNGTCQRGILMIFLIKLVRFLRKTGFRLNEVEIFEN